MSDRIYRTGRRALLIGSAALAAVGVPVPVPAAVTEGDDAELLALCRQFHRLDAEATALSGYDDWETLNETMGERWKISDLIEEIRPATVHGLRMKAGVGIALLVENRGDDGSGDSDACFALTTLRDIADGASPVAAAPAMAPALTPKGDDAELLRAIAEYERLEWQFLALFHGPHRIENDDERLLREEAIWEVQEPLFARICALPATTAEGIAARVRMMLLWDQGFDPEKAVTEDADLETRMSTALLRNLATRAGLRHQDFRARLVLARSDRWPKPGMPGQQKPPAPEPREG